MKNKIELYILGGVIVLLLAYIVFREDKNINYTIPTTATFKAEEINNIEFDDFKMTKDGDNWLLPSGYTASKIKTDKITADLSSFKIIDMISASKDYSRFGLDDPKTLSVKQGDKLLLELKVGNTSSTGNYTYIMLPGHSEVYSVRGDYTTLIPEENELRNKVVLSFNNAQKVIITKDNEANELDADKIQAIIPIINELKAVNFNQPERKDQLMSIEIEADSSHSLIIYNEVDGEYPATSSDVDFPFTISKYTVDKLLNL